MPRNGVSRGAGERFPASERLRLGEEYERVYRDGRPIRSPLMVLFVLASPDLPRKAGFVAGRRVGGAVIRNRAKRLLRECYRRHRSLVPPSGIFLVFVARAGCGEASYADVERDMLTLIGRACPGAEDTTS